MKVHHPVSCIAENIRSLYNVGSLFRTCDGAGVDRLYLCGYTGYPPRKEISKTALGSEKSVPWERHVDTLALARSLKEKGVALVCLEHTERSRPFREVECPFPLALVLGNEVEGVTPALRQEADIHVHIPMYGTKESLNVTVAAGIVLYDFVDRFRSSQQSACT
jgi:tRNA G18 (ribose-2'-O)-methylase SpoU